MPGVSTFWFAALRPKSKAMYTGFLLAFITGVLEADIITNPSSTWYDGIIKCRQHGLSMVTSRYATLYKNITYPIWANGFEVRVNYLDEFFIIDKLHENGKALVRCMNSKSPVGNLKPMQFEEGHKYCQKQSNGSHIHLPFVNHTNLDMFRWLNGVPNWIQAVNVGPFLNSEDLTVHCLVLNGFELFPPRKDNCTNKYASICVNETFHDIIWYRGRGPSDVKNCDPTSCRTPVSSSAVTSEFMTSLVTAETYIGVDLNTSVANTPFYLDESTSDPKTEEEAKTSSIIIISTTLGSCLVVLIVIISGLCLKRKQGNNTRIIFQQNELVQPSIVPQEVHDDNSVHVDVISDNIAGREATPYTSLQMTEKHLYTALVGPSFMSTETSSVIGRIANRDFHVETQFEMFERQENKYDEIENDDPGDSNYDDVEVLEKDIPGQTSTESEATTSYSFVK
ncbi:uncharacterized protein LOC127860904 [Dreissena polymorpha]|uniref:uncharacterized protein LOC127860904 n=1 Tax=Dreissena polymorpha TaxID=45954 RepID=UPI0022653837|nr:uncharacterized protein LOC127860904 [Dreissena polymorpha]